MVYLQLGLLRFKLTIMKKQQRPITSRIAKRIGARLKTFRQAQKLSQQDLSEQLEISTAFAGEIERGDVDCSLKTLEKIADTLNVPVAELVSDEPTSPKNLWITRLTQLLPKFSNKQLANLYELLTSLLKK